MILDSQNIVSIGIMWGSYNKDFCLISEIVIGKFWGKCICIKHSRGF